MKKKMFTNQQVSLSHEQKFQALIADIQAGKVTVSVDEIARLLNIQKEIASRKAAKEQKERLLIKSNATKRIMYAIAYESMTETGVLYTHASNRNEAIAGIVMSQSLKNYRIVAVGPAVGAWSPDGKTAYHFS